MKRTLAIVVALLMVMTLIPMTAGAESSIKDFSSSRLVPRHEATREAVRDDVVTDASLVNQNFDDTSTLGDWWLYDADGDDDNWGLTSNTNIVYGGSGYSIVSASYTSSTGAIDADNWLVTPAFTVPAGDVYLTFQGKDQDPSYLDSLQVLVGEDGEAYDDTSIYPDAWTTIRALAPLTGTWTQYAYSLSQFAGQTISVAFRHKDNDMFYVVLDEVQVGIAGDIVDVTAVTVDPATLTLGVTEGAKLTAAVEPSNATFQSVTWSSSDPSVVAVNKSGGILAMSAGTATVTATASNGVAGSCVVTVEAGEYEYAGNLITYGVYNGDATTEEESNPNNWYWVDEFGAMELAAEDGVNTFVKGAWNPVDQLFYAYRSNDDETMDFVSIDPNNDMAVTVITAGIADNPWWISYGFDTGVMYGGFLKFDSSDAISGFEFAEIDLATGLEGNVLVDVYNETMGGDEAMEFLPLHTTYAGGGIFIGADYSYGELIMYAPNYQDQGFAAGMVSDYDLSTQVTGGIQTYMQDIYYNPMDGMLYWAYVGNTCQMVVMDIASGVAVPTGATGEAGASFGIECSILDGLYTMTQTYTVEFYDSITGELIASVEVAEGEAAEAPEAPVHEGYTFVGWDADFSNVTEDMTVYTIYEEVSGPEILLGDADCNGVVNFADVGVMYLFCSGDGQLSEQGELNADVDGNGTVTFADISALYLALIGG